jgi:hypothetical protein
LLVRVILQILLIVIFLLVLGFAGDSRREVTPTGIAVVVGALAMLGMMFAATFGIGEQKKTRSAKRHGASSAVLGSMFILGCLVAIATAGFVYFGGTLEVHENVGYRVGGRYEATRACFARFVQTAGAWWPATMLLILGIAAGLRGFEMVANWKPGLRVRQFIVAGLLAPPALILLPMILVC